MSTTEQKKGDAYVMNPSRVWAYQVQGMAEEIELSSNKTITVFPGDWVVTMPTGRKIAFTDESFQRYFRKVRESYEDEDSSIQGRPGVSI